MAYSNPYLVYEVNQAGGDLPAFYGVKWQRGHGFFGRIFKSVLLPALKYVGRNALGLGANIVQDHLSGKDLKEAAKSRLKETGSQAVDDLGKRAQKFIQTGKGRGRKRSKAKPKGRSKSKCVTSRSKSIKRPPAQPIRARRTRRLQKRVFPF